MNEYKVILKDALLHSLKEIVLLASSVDQAQNLAKESHPNHFVKAIYLKEFEEFYDN